ncbi:MAG TPA: chemotaxis protein CheB [Vicinamibacterales bacterium]|nr:chemotaxis protein CheB [Vicinamibacterales bacterium]
MINVAIADDSPFTCKLLASYVEDGGECKVVGMAHDAQSTLDLIRRETPDVLTLDLQMPGSDGLELLRQLASEPPVSVVVISGVTRLAAATTLKALELGAVDFILKYTPSVPVSRASLRREIISKVKAAAAAHPSRRTAPAAPAPAAVPSTPARTGARPSVSPDSPGVVVIGASTGGPTAIRELINQLAADFTTPCVVVQHLPAAFTAPFAAQLGRHAQLKVKVAASGDHLQPGVALVAPGSMHLVIRPDGRISLQTPAEKDFYRPSIDLAMASAAEAYGAAAVGVVLTGIGNDGSEGLKRIRDAGGECFVQEISSCIVPSMPERALQRAGADLVATPERIGQALSTRRKA